MASLRDVADRAGVSLATASRVASGSTAVRPETRDRVEGAMRELLYVPSRPVETSSAIGLFVPEFSNPVFAALAEAMEMHAARATSPRSSATRTARPGASATTCGCCSSAESRG
jgi:LacI family transcriptional regulator